MAIWKDLIDYNGLYLISNEGEIANMKGHIIATRKNQRGIVMISLRKNNKSHHHTVALLMLRSFNQPCNPGETSYYKDGNPENLHINNLGWRKFVPANKKYFD